MNAEGRPRKASDPPWIVIADDHPLVRQALNQTLDRHSDVEVVGEATDGQEALELCRRLRPDLVLMDVRMPRMDGIAATRAIKGEFPNTVVVLLTALEEPHYLAEALKAGAAGYVLEEASHKQIADSVGRALSGESPLNQEVAMGLLMRMLGDDEAQDTTQEDVYSATTTGLARLAGPSVSEGAPASESSLLLETLTEREVKVLSHMARGQTNQQISRSLLISVSTVKNHVRQVIAKLGVSDRTQAAIKAVELGLLPSEE